MKKMTQVRHSDQSKVQHKKVFGKWTHVRHLIDYHLQLGYVVDEEDDAGEAFG